MGVWADGGRRRVAAAGAALVVATLAVAAVGVGQRCDPAHSEGWSAARVWNEQALDAIRRDFPAPTVHARNLYHLSTVGWDVWAAAHPNSRAVLVDRNVEHTEADTEMAIHAASHRFLTERYRYAVAAEESLASFDAALTAACLDPDRAGENPAVAFGIEVAEATLDATRDDGARETSGYVDLSYTPVNRPLVVAEPGTELVDPNRWQPLSLERQVTQNGQLLPGSVQTFIGPQWGSVTPFALPSVTGTDPAWLALDPGPPPAYGSIEFAEAALDVIRYGARLDPAADNPIRIDPGVRGDNPLGTNDGDGHGRNPATDVAYSPQRVQEADYGRVVAEYWADGPDSETPPGHWNTIANEVSDRLPPDRRRVGGQGPSLKRLEWDLKLHLALNGALHDAAIVAWGTKAHYDYARPISMIRHLGRTGELPLERGLSEIVTGESAGPGGRHEHLADHIGEIAVRGWRGQPDDPTEEVAGVDWILAENWVPYQRASFVTPAFAAYVSGHSTFSRAGAEVLTAITADPYFPGGLALHRVEPGGLIHEYGPTEVVELQWATYRDAADEAGLSRIYGGIHVEADDRAGRLLGAEVGRRAWTHAQTFFDD